MKRLVVGLTSLVAATGPLLVQTAYASASTPVIFISPTSTAVGGTVSVHGMGLQPEQDVSVAICGDAGLEGSQGCDLRGQATLMTDQTGYFAVQLVVSAPPVPCPCVVEVDTTSASLHTALAIAGVPVGSVRPAAVALGPDLHITRARIEGGGGWQSWFGWPSRRTLVVTVADRGGGKAPSPTMNLELSSWESSGQTIATPMLSTVPAGASRTYHLPLNLGSFAVGEYTLRGTVYAGADSASFRAGVFAVPWGLFIIAALIAQALLLLLRNRLRTHLSRGPIEAVVAEEGTAHVIVSVVDVTERTFDAPAACNAPRVPDGAWTVTVRLATFVHERGLTCGIERLSCPSLGFQRTRATVWEDFAYAPWEALHDDTSWQSAPAGLADENRIEYESHGTRVDVVFIPEAPARSLREGHIIEPGRVLGHLTVDGETMILSGETVRHQTWSATPDSDDNSFGARIPDGLSYAFTGDAVGFVLETGYSGSSGWLCRDGCVASVVSGRHIVESRCGPYPLEVKFDLRDALGRTLEASGVVRNGMASKSGPDQLVMSCLTVWDVDGTRMIGESREVITVEDWRAWRRTEQPQNRVSEL